MHLKKTILVFPFNLLSHYLRCIVFVNKYCDRALYDILFLSSPQYNKYIHQHGYGTFECDQFDADKVMKCAAKFDFSWLNRSDIEKIFLAQRNVILKFNPEIVIGDTAPALKMAAESTGTKYLVIMNGYMTKYYNHPRRLSRTHKGYKLSKKIPDKYFDKITQFAEKLAFAGVHRPFNALRKKYGLKKIAGYLNEIEGDQNFICDNIELFPQKALPSYYKVIGPLIYTEHETDNKWLEDIEESKPVICITMGSSGNWKKLDFLNDNYYSKYAIITAGDTSHVLHGPHVINRHFVNLMEVVAKADLLICHGGNGTIYTGLLNGVFMLCLTSNFEQEWNVQALERKGYGLLANDFTDTEWKDKIAEGIAIRLKRVDSSGRI